MTEYLSRRQLRFSRAGDPQSLRVRQPILDEFNHTGCQTPYGHQAEYFRGLEINLPVSSES